MVPDTTDGDDSDPSSEDDSGEQTEITDVEAEEEDTADVANVEVVDVNSPQPTEDVQQLTAYEGNVGNGVTYRILPQFTRAQGARWVAVFYLQGGQGPIDQMQNVTEDQAVDLGMTEKERQHINSLVAQANEEIEIPRSLRGQSMDNEPVSALEDALESA